MPRHAVVYIGIDPGLANTGITIVKRDKSNRIKMVHAERFVTKKADKDRVGMIRTRLRELSAQYGVNRAICETFEVRTWEGAKNYSVAMCKLVNAISEEFYQLQIPFLLSSPNNKRGIHLDDLPEAVRDEIMSRPKTHREHIEDAFIHVWYQVMKRGN